MKTKPRGAHVPHEKKLAKLEKQLAVTRSAEELSDLALKFHMVNYSLGHDIPAIIAMPQLVDRASHGKLRANERAGEAHLVAGDVCRSLHSLFTALETYPDDHADRVRIVARMAEALGPIDSARAAQLQAHLVRLPDDVAEARQEFANRMHGAKGAIDWESLPGGE